MSSAKKSSFAQTPQLYSQQSQQGHTSLTSMEFPSNSGMLSLVPSSLHQSDGLPAPLVSVEDIAKEAMRLTKATLMAHASTVPPSGVPSGQANLNRSAPSSTRTSSTRLNKFVRRLHDMLQAEHGHGIVEWRRGLLVLHSTHAFAKRILPKYFNTRNFKTFRRQLNYYGFVHVRSFSTTGSSTTALWVNRDLAQSGSDEISSVLQMRRVEPCEASKTAEGRRNRKVMALHTVEEDLGVNAKSLQLQQIQSLAMMGRRPSTSSVPLEIHCNNVSGSDDGSTSVEDPEINSASSATSNHPESDDDSVSAANLLLLLARSQ